MKPLHFTRHAHPAHPHHLGREGSHVMLPLFGLSLMALILYFAVKQFDISELGRSALFYVVMATVAVGIAGLFGSVGAWLHSDETREETGFCFVGALVGAAVFYFAMLS